MEAKVYVIDLGIYRPNTYPGSLGRVLPSDKQQPRVLAVCDSKPTAMLLSQAYGSATYGVANEGIYVGTPAEVENYARQNGGETMHKIFNATAAFRC